jgi:hypothetical protein
MVGYLSNKPKLSFVDDPGKLYRQRRRATQAKGLETLDSKAKVEGPSKSPRELLLQVQRKINLNRHPWENNHNRSARSSYAPRTSLIYLS